jgi:homogentisate 1,2-dioxygenase
VDYFIKCGCWDENDFHPQRKETCTMMGTSRLNMEITLLLQVGVIYQIDFDTEIIRFLLYVESFCAYLYAKKTYKKMNQADLEHVSICERDFILPTELRL